MDEVRLAALSDTRREQIGAAFEIGLREGVVEVLEQEGQRTWQLCPHAGRRLLIRASMLAQLDEKKLPQLDETARILGCSRRQVQRSLTAAATCWQDELDAELSQAARALVPVARAQGLRVAFYVARRLGYSDESGFHRAFVRWTGSTPGEYASRHSQTEVAS